VVSNAELAVLGAPLAPDEMERLTGVRERRWVAEDEATSDMAAAAGRAALAAAGMGPEAVDRLVLATVSPDHPSPATACFVHAALGLGPVPAYDLAAACAGYVFALDAAARAVVTGEERVLAIAADVRSRYLNVQDRATCALFADGAGAALLAPGPVGVGLVAVGLVADGTGARSIHVPAGGTREPASAETLAAGRHTIVMADGPRIYLEAVAGMLHVGAGVLEACGLGFADVDLLVPHQANLHVIRRVAWKAGLPLERVAVDIDTTGNTSGATTALALDRAVRAGRVGPGARVLIVAAGAGYTAGAALLVL
jgi:3-oxoacyl-[acyl-carrier-protein] synthase-3